MKSPRVLYVFILLLFLLFSQISAGEKLAGNDLIASNPNPGSSTGQHFIGQTYYPSVDVQAAYSYPVDPASWWVLFDIIQNGQSVYLGSASGVDLSSGRATVTSGVPFSPTTSGSYEIIVDINYPDDFNQNNNTASNDFAIYGPPGAIQGPSPSPGSVIDYAPAQTFIWGNCTNPITLTQTVLSPVNPLIGEALTTTLDSPGGHYWTPPNDLEPSTEYDLEIHQSNPAGTTVNGPYRYSTKAEPCAPSVQIIEPENGAVDVPLNPVELVWGESTNPALTGYDVWLSTEASGVDPSAVPAYSSIDPGQTTAPIPWEMREPGNTVYARVGANCPDGTSYSDVSSWTFGDDRWPDPPVFVDPLTGEVLAHVPKIAVELETPVIMPTGPVTTDIWLGPSLSDVTPGTNFAVTNTVGFDQTLIYLPGPFETDQDYFIRAVYNCGEGDDLLQLLSDIVSFKTAPGSSISGSVSKTYDPNLPGSSFSPPFEVQVQVEVPIRDNETSVEERSVPIDQSGQFTLPDLPFGDYELQLQTPPGWTYVTPSDGAYQGYLEPGQNIPGREFIIIPPPAKISGEKWKDDDGDGEKDDNENKIPGWQITLNGNSYAGNSISMSTPTAEDGGYVFENVPPGSYVITEADVSGWTQTFPPEGEHNVEVDNGENEENKDFGNAPPGLISGYKFHDINNNGQWDDSEPGLNGVEISLIQNGSILSSTITNTNDANGDFLIDPEFENGYFIFRNLEPGVYIVAEESPPGWIQTVPGDPGYYEVNLEPGGQITDLVFGNMYPDGLDFGDLPEPIDDLSSCLLPQCYPTTLPFGAHHAAIGPMLGLLRDIEPNGQPELYARGDDTNNFDEDGVSFLKFVPGSKGEAEVTITGTQDDFPCYLSAWIDFNGDGFLGFGGINPEEKILSERIDAGGTYTFEFDIPMEIVSSSYSRFRLSTKEACVDLPFGPAIDGEVEDYYAYGFDFGDAPMPYPTLAADGGAKHLLGNYYLGELIDAEFEGQPDNNALGDDNNGLNDEDGIKFITELVKSHTAHIEIKAKAPPGLPGYLNAWIDFNRDGIWDPSDEKIFSDILLPEGIDTLHFQIPDTAKIGVTFARFRYSEFPGLNPSDRGVFESVMIMIGEVEDYLVAIDSLTVSFDEDFGFVPKEYKLYQNYPNPFNPYTTITYDVVKDRFVNLVVYNILGQKISTLVNETKKAGRHTARFGTEGLPSGIYIYQIEMGDYIKTMKMILMK